MVAIALAGLMLAAPSETALVATNGTRVTLISDDFDPDIRAMAPMRDAVTTDNIRATANVISRVVRKTKAQSQAVVVNIAYVAPKKDIVRALLKGGEEREIFAEYGPDTCSSQPCVLTASVVYWVASSDIAHNNGDTFSFKIDRSQADDIVINVPISDFAAAREIAATIQARK